MMNPMVGGAPMLASKDIVDNAVNSADHTTLVAAVKAAGRIHSDIERGFIRAEVIGWQDYVECGSLPEAKRRGLLRIEGKTYPVQDGDVINVLFNV